MSLCHSRTRLYCVSICCTAVHSLSGNAYVSVGFLCTGFVFYSIYIFLDLSFTLLSTTAFLSLQSCIMQVEFKKPEGGGLGFALVGGTNGSMLRVKEICSGGVAEQDGRLRVGDILLEVNGVIVSGLSHSKVVDILRKVVTSLTSVLLCSTYTRLSPLSLCFTFMFLGLLDWAFTTRRRQRAINKLTNAVAEAL
uniref:PDZ domain-containing protein n=1 Tax=Echeneis naucrates TaxID=173247 RepID=A0A665UVL4_ECHNA